MPSRLQLIINLQLGTGLIAGQVCNGLDVVRPFRGWLELAAAIKQLRAEAPAEDRTRIEPGCSAERLPPVPGSRARKGSGVGD